MSILDGEYYTYSESKFWLYLSITAFVLVWAAIMAGLTTGLMSIDPLKFKLLKQTGTRIEQNQIKKLEPLLKDHHLLLTTIVTANCVAMEALPLVLEEICPKWIGFLFSITLLLIFGEIVPQAICLADPLLYGARFVPLIYFMKIVLYPLAKPVAWILEKLIGHQQLFKHTFIFI